LADQISIINSKIDASDQTLREILNEQRYSIDYFQREYRWERKHVEQLLADIEASFFSNFKEGHGRPDVKSYNSYYMGPIVILNQDAVLSIIDGQQRLTTITLLLINIHNIQKGFHERENIEGLIRSTSFGIRSYNLDIDERIECIDSLYDGREFTAPRGNESVQNLVNRYSDIEELLSDELTSEKVLPFFIDWLKGKLIFVKIVAYSDENAYTIFETMNDRGLSLTPTEMLKGYLLSQVPDEKKDVTNDFWRKRISELYEYGDGEDLEFFRAWFRAKYADTIRPGKKGALNEDFEKIGTSFHSWVKDRKKLLGLSDRSSYVEFLRNDFDFYSKIYLRIADSKVKLRKELEYVYFIDYYGIAPSLMDPLLMAPIKPSDDDATINAKINVVARFIEIFTITRMVNYRTIAQSALRYTFYLLVKEIRDSDLKALVGILKKKINEFDEGLDGILSFGLHGSNKRFVRYLLARITNYIEEESGTQSSLGQYMSDDATKPFEIEHIWNDNYDEFIDEFDQRDDFKRMRNLIGGLILLPRGTNQSFNDASYEEKLPHYLKENLLAKSLNKKCYEKNPNFTNFVASSNIPFVFHEHFRKKDLNERTALYEEICKKMWSLEGFDDIVANVS